MQSCDTVKLTAINGYTAWRNAIQTYSMLAKPDTTADKLAMLLSTDWFTPYWSVIRIDAKDRVCFQKGCRDIVKVLIGRAKNYYLISFADERISATRDAMKALGAICNLSDQAAATLQAICAPRVERDEKQTTAWMLTTVTWDALTEDIELAPAVREVLLRSRKFFAADSEALAESCKTSQTEWDLYVQQLTPELPCSLSDFVCVGLLPELQLDFIFGQLDPEQRESLLFRYKAAVVKITGLNEAAVPDSWR